MERLKIKSFGPIANADIKFGSLTILVGPQASGKSILLQLFKLLIDKKHIRKSLLQYSFQWGKDPNKILDLYFGEGMSGIWNAESKIDLNGRSITKKAVLPVGGRMIKTDEAEETIFYIPAQRILSVSDGRPKNFMEFDLPTPYVLRQYSETIRKMFQNGVVKPESIFPLNTRLKEVLSKSFNDSIFHDGKVVMEESGGQKKLRMKIGGMSLPYISWSAGQKEFLPLLLGFYWLYPPSKNGKKENIEYVIIEEPEMGLHPQAIKSIILQIIDLLSRGYKVIVSTHSPVLLEFAWAFNYLKKSRANDDSLLELFDLQTTLVNKKLVKNILSEKNINTYYFDRENAKVVVKDISTLDAGSDDLNISEWGGISSFATKAAEVVSKNIPL